MQTLTCANRFGSGIRVGLVLTTEGASTCVRTWRFRAPGVKRGLDGREDGLVGRVALRRVTGTEKTGGGLRGRPPTWPSGRLEDFRSCTPVDFLLGRCRLLLLFTR